MPPRIEVAILAGGSMSCWELLVLLPLWASAASTSYYPKDSISENDIDKSKTANARPDRFSPAYHQDG